MMAKSMRVARKAPGRGKDWRQSQELLAVTVKTGEGGGHMGHSAPSFSTGCGWLGVSGFSPTLVVAGGLAPALKRKLLIGNDGCKSDRAPDWWGQT